MNIILLGYNDTRLQRHKISPFHDVITEFDCIVRILKQRLRRLAGHERQDAHINVLYQNLRGRDHLEDLGVEGRTSRPSMKMALKETEARGVAWFDLAQ